MEFPIVTGPDLIHVLAFHDANLLEEDHHLGKLLLTPPVNAQELHFETKLQPVDVFHVRPRRRQHVFYSSGVLGPPLFIRQRGLDRRLEFLTHTNGLGRTHALPCLFVIDNRVAS